MWGAARNRRAAFLVALALLLAVGLLGRLWYVHDRTWDWSLTISATPPKIQFADRTYLRSTADMAVPVGAVDVGRRLGLRLSSLPSHGELPKPSVRWEGAPSLGNLGVGVAQGLGT